MAGAAVDQLLFLQWPLRDFVQSLFARGQRSRADGLRAVRRASVTAATRADSHLAADLVAQRYSNERGAGWSSRSAVCSALLPWAVFVAGRRQKCSSHQRTRHEAFRSSGNPGYFVVKIALWLWRSLSRPGDRSISRPLKADER